MTNNQIQRLHKSRHMCKSFCLHSPIHLQVWKRQKWWKLLLSLGHCLLGSLCCDHNHLSYCTYPILCWHRFQSGNQMPYRIRPVVWPTVLCHCMYLRPPHMWEFYYITLCKENETVVYWSKYSFFKTEIQHRSEDNHLSGQYCPDSTVLCFHSYTV